LFDVDKVETAVASGIIREEAVTEERLPVVAVDVMPTGRVDEDNVRSFLGIKSSSKSGASVDRKGMVLVFIILALPTKAT
jgi:2-keto-3-deoxy-6-phosphogluconate aldolase